jgi:hypothetical protein
MRCAGTVTNLTAETNCLRSLLCFTLALASTAAQPPIPFAVLEDRQLPALPHAVGIASGDFDRDGDVDLLRGQ